jgi:hypothetical protein
MAYDRYVTITVAYDSHPSYGRSLEWIAPELSDAGLTLIEDHISEPRPWRTWAGAVDELTFKRFADDWHLDRLADKTRVAAQSTYTFDGMNWDSGGTSPIVSVSVHVTTAPDGARTETRAAPAGTKSA